MLPLLLFAAVHSVAGKPFPQLTEQQFRSGARSLETAGENNVFMISGYSQVRVQGGRAFEQDIKFPELTVKNPSQLNVEGSSKVKVSLADPVYKEDDINKIVAEIDAINQREADRIDMDETRATEVTQPGTSTENPLGEVEISHVATDIPLFPTDAPQKGTEVPEEGTVIPRLGTEAPSLNTEVPHHGTEVTQEKTVSPNDGSETTQGGQEASEQGTQALTQTTNPQDVVETFTESVVELKHEKTTLNVGQTVETDHISTTISSNKELELNSIAPEIDTMEIVDPAHLDASTLLQDQLEELGLQDHLSEAVKTGAKDQEEEILEGSAFAPLEDGVHPELLVPDQLIIEEVTSTPTPRDFGDIQEI